MILNTLIRKAAKIPGLLLKSNVSIDSEYKEAVLKEIDIERQWYKNIPSFTTIAAMKKAEMEGTLSKVVGNSNYLPILRLRNPELHEKFPPFVLTEAKELLDEIGEKWRTEVKKAGFSDKIQLAVSSLSRTVSYQKALVKAGKLADPESVHTKGAAFDIDASGYYLDGTPINARNTEQEGYDKAFKDLGASDGSPRFGDYALYEPKVHEILKDILNEMMTEEKLHFVHEFPGTKNDVFHVCLNPKIKEQEVM
jgi:hypothetical protein